ncbi:MAG: hypothetical protein ACOC4K_01110, partial [Verrucomicrobiota bacterium]
MKVPKKCIQRLIFAFIAIMPVIGLNSTPNNSTPYSWQESHSTVTPEGTLEWAPEPFVFEAGSTVYYIDYENGDDANAGTSTSDPWKHHPWDANATAVAATASGPATYVFKGGVIYRGELEADESGAEAEPIRLTTDPNWGTGKAWFLGSDRLNYTWQQATADDVPQYMDPTDIWFVDANDTAYPRAATTTGTVTAYFADSTTAVVDISSFGQFEQTLSPNWTNLVKIEIDTENPARLDNFVLDGNAIDFEGYTLGETETNLIQDSGFDFTTDKDNWDIEGRVDQYPSIVIGSNKYGSSVYTIEKTDGTPFSLDSFGYMANRWPDVLTRGEALFQVVNGNELKRIRIARDPDYQAGNPNFPMDYWHQWDGPGPKPGIGQADFLKGYPDDYFNGMTMRSQWKGNMGTATLTKPDYDTYDSANGYLAGVPITAAKGTRFTMLDLPQFCDAPGEFYVSKQNQLFHGNIYIRMPNDEDPNTSTIEMPTRGELIKITDQSNIHITNIRFSMNGIANGYLSSRSVVDIYGDCQDIKVSHCEFDEVTGVLTADARDPGETDPA